MSNIPDGYGELRDATALLGDPEALRARLAEDSYLFFRGLIPSEKVEQAGAEMLSVSAELGWLEDGTPVQEAMAGAGAKHLTDEGYFDAHNAWQSLQSLHEVATHKHLRAVVTDVLDGESVTHPRRIVRVTLPETPTNVTPPHQDFRHIQGPADVLTTWIPFGRVPPELGGLKVLVGSARYGVLAPVHTDRPGGLTLDVPAGEWATTTFEPGDVLLFHSFTVHAAMPNRTARLRLSMDVRHQRTDAPIAADWLGPDGGSAITGGWETLAREWSSLKSIDAPTDMQIITLGDPFDEALPVPDSALITIGR
jgi:hypothetical protein